MPYDNFLTICWASREWPTCMLYIYKLHWVCKKRVVAKHQTVHEDVGDTQNVSYHNEYGLIKYYQNKHYTYKRRIYSINKVSTVSTVEYFTSSYRVLSHGTIVFGCYAATNTANGRTSIYCVTCARSSTIHKLWYNERLAVNMQNIPPKQRDAWWSGNTA